MSDITVTVSPVYTITAVVGVQGPKGVKGDAGAGVAANYTDAMDAANNPSANNAFATITDVPSTAGLLNKTAHELLSHAGLPGVPTQYTDQMALAAAPAETATTIKTALGITTLSGSNTGDQDLSGLQPITAVMLAKTGAYTLVAADNGKIVHCDGTFTVTLPKAATEDLPDGFTAIVWNIGTGVITLAIESGDTLTSTSATIAPKTAKTVWKRTDTFWYNS